MTQTRSIKTPDVPDAETFMDAKAGSLPVTKETVGSSEISSINRSLSSCDAPSVTRMSNSACA